jgi:hypothetical protein
MHKSASFICLFSILFVTACSDDTPSSSSTEVIVGPTFPPAGYPASDAISEDPTAYPAPEDRDKPGYPAPTIEFIPPTSYPGAATPFPVRTPEPEDLAEPEPPSPAAGLGAVSGQLLHEDSGATGSGLTIYLGVKVEAEPGPAYYISTQRNSSPQAETNAGGYFVINDVEPGLYALVLGSLIGSRVLENPETGQEYWVEVTSGEITEVSEVVFTFP